MRTRSLAPNTRSGRGRNVRPLNAPPAPGGFAAVLRKSRRVTSDSDDIDHLLLCDEPLVGLGDAGLNRVSVMDEHAVTKDRRAARRNVVRPASTAVTGKRFDPEWIRGQETVGACVPVGRSAEVERVIEDRDSD